jgi:hypothetical protein
MAQEVLGSGFKFVIQSMLGAELLFPELRARVAGMRDEQWYSWAEYVAATQAIAALLDDATVAAIGQDIMLVAKPLLQAQGFASPEALLGDWRQVFQSNVRGLDSGQLPHTVEARDGMALVEYGAELPAALVEGYLRGAVLMFDRRVEAYDATPTLASGVPRLQCRIAWQ